MNIAAQLPSARANVTAAVVPDTVLLDEGFENANLTARNWYDTTTPTIVSGARPGSAGTNCLRWNWTTGLTAPSGVGRYDFATGVTEFYIEYWVRWSSNWVGSGQDYHPHMFQIITDVDDHFIGPSVTHLTLYTEQLYVGANLKTQPSIQDALMIDTAHLNQNRFGIDENHSVGGYNGQPTSSGGGAVATYDLFNYGGSPIQYTNYLYLRDSLVTVADSDKTNWHKVREYWKLNTISGGVGQADGICRTWIDGNLHIDRTNLYLRTGANPTMKFKTLVMAPYIGDGSPINNQYMDIDDLRILAAIPQEVPTQLAMVTQPAGATSGVAFTQQPAVNHKDVSGIVTATAATVTASIASGSGSLSGTTAVATDATGKATFTNLVITGSGAHTLLFTSSVGGVSTVTSASFTVAAASAVLTGTATASIVESDIVTGGKTIILTLTSETWVASGATFNAQRQNILNGFVSAGAETNGWNNRRVDQPVTAVVRTSNTVVTITLAASATYDITANETITCTIPGTALTGGNALVASPTFVVAFVNTSVLHANEPAGMTAIATHTMASPTESGWTIDSGSVSSSTDGTAPVTSNVVLATYPTGFSSGGSPWTLEHQVTTVTAKRKYTCIVCKWSSNFYGDSSGTNKVDFDWTGGQAKVFVSAEGTGTGNLTLTQRLQATADPRGDGNGLVPNLNTSFAIIQRNVWHRIERELVGNTSGQANGEARMWVSTWNGSAWSTPVKIIEYTNVQYNTGAATFDLISIAPIWGGIAGSVPAPGQSLSFNHYYASGKTS